MDSKRALPQYATVAGADVSYNLRGKWLHAAVVVLRADTFEVIARSGVVAEAKFPYVPGLLSFREAPAVIEAFEKLSVRPDILMCDGQGIAHPRRMGLAAHLGLYLGLPTIGCAKSWLCGEYEEPGFAGRMVAPQGSRRNDWCGGPDSGGGQADVHLARASVRPGQRDRGRSGHIAHLPAADHIASGTSVCQRPAAPRARRKSPHKKKDEVGG